MIEASMKEILRFKIRRPFYLGRRHFSSGLVTLEQIFPAVKSLLALGSIEEVPVDEPFSGFVVLLDDSDLGEKGEVLQTLELERYDISRLERVCFLLRLYDAELNQVFMCKDCSKSFFGRAQMAAHKAKTGHRMKKHQKSLEPEESEV